MSSQKTDALLELIEALSKAEKRHFRLFAKRNQASDDLLFLQLFDFLDRYKQYDEAQILAKIPGIKKRQLSNLKAHLYRQLLTSLRLLNTQHSPEMQIREMLDYGRVLYDKGLYRQSLQILDKAKEKASAAHFHALTFEILHFEKHIEGQYVTHSKEGRADQLTQESNQLAQMLGGIRAYSNLSLQLYSLYLQTGYARNQQDHERVSRFFQANLPDHAYEGLDVIGKIHHCQSYIWFHFILQDFPACYRHAWRWVDLFRQNPGLVQLHAPLYLKGLHNLLNALFNMWYYDRFVVVLGWLEAFPEKYPMNREWNIEGLHTFYHYWHRIKKHYMEGSYSDGLALVPGLERIIEENVYHWDSHRILVFYYRIACLFFGSGDFDRAIDYLNLIINQKSPDYRTDIQSFSRILNLIAHFELGNARLVEYQAKSVYRFLAKMEDLQAVQQEIFRFLQRSFRVRPEELQGEFVSLRDRLKEIEKDPYERRPFLYLDIISWLDSKIEGKTVQEVVQEKFARRRVRPEFMGSDKN